MLNAEDYVPSSAKPHLTRSLRMSMEGLPQPLLVFGYNTEGNQHCWSMGWGEPRGEENHGSSRHEHSAPAAAVWPEDGDGLGRPKFNAASCWATSEESFVLWTSLPQSFPRLFSEVLKNLLMWLKKKHSTRFCWHGSRSSPLWTLLLSLASHFHILLATSQLLVSLTAICNVAELRHVTTEITIASVALEHQHHEGQLSFKRTVTNPVHSLQRLLLHFLQVKSAFRMTTVFKAFRPM